MDRTVLLETLVTDYPKDLGERQMRALLDLARNLPEGKGRISVLGVFRHGVSRRFLLYEGSNLQDEIAALTEDRCCRGGFVLQKKFEDGAIAQYMVTFGPDRSELGVAIYEEVGEQPGGVIWTEESDLNREKYLEPFLKEGFSVPDKNEIVMKLVQDEDIPY